MTSWFDRAAELAGTVTLDVAGFDVTVELTPRQLCDVFVPLLARLDAAAQAQRVLAGVCGIPAAGKSTFAAALRHVADVLLGPGRLQIVGMDGWHLPSAVLDARMTRDASGRLIPLRECKGGPESYDAEAMIQALTALRTSPDPVELPVYDRRIHEPRPAGVSVSADTRIVVVEGNYVLGGVRGVAVWDRLAALLSPKLFIECDPLVARHRIIERHLRGGTTPAEAMHKYESNDRINTQLVLDASAYADYHIFAFLDTRPAVSVWPPWAGA